MSDCWRQKMYPYLHLALVIILDQEKGQGEMSTL